MKKRTLPVWARLLLLLLVFCAVVRGIPHFVKGTERPEIYTVEVEENPPPEVPDGVVSLHFTGISMLRSNALYINEKRVKIAYWSGINYGECRIAVDPSVLPRGEAVSIRVGKSYPISLGVLYRSNKLTVTL